MRATIAAVVRTIAAIAKACAIGLLAIQAAVQWHMILDMEKSQLAMLDREKQIVDTVRTLADVVELQTGKTITLPALPKYPPPQSSGKLKTVDGMEWCGECSQNHRLEGGTCPEGWEKTAGPFERDGRPVEGCKRTGGKGNGATDYIMPGEGMHIEIPLGPQQSEGVKTRL